MNHAVELFLDTLAVVSGFGLGAVIVCAVALAGFMALDKWDSRR